MTLIHLIAWFFAGALMANAVPHLVSGMCGRAFQTPFATPSGVGLSSATVNVAWGFANLVAGDLLLVQVGAFDPRAMVDAAAPALGGLLIALFHARHFGQFHGSNAPQ